jgi:hypothetical protein
MFPLSVLALGCRALKASVASEIILSGRPALVTSYFMALRDFPSLETLFFNTFFFCYPLVSVCVRLLVIISFSARTLPFLRGSHYLCDRAAHSLWRFCFMPLGLAAASGVWNWPMCMHLFLNMLVLWTACILLFHQFLTLFVGRALSTRISIALVLVLGLLSALTATRTLTRPFR